jgi:hypothetical protein
MSRITTPPAQDGQALTAADLNSRFTAFSQAGAVNGFNTRDGAFDLPQFSSTPFMAPLMATGVIGRDDWKHTAYNTDAAPAAGPASPFLVRDAAGTATPLALGGASGWTMTTEQVLRVYWDLSVRPRYTPGTTPWLTVGSLGFWDVGSGAATLVGSGMSCWAFWLQWDLTSSALVNWVDVPQQSSFNDAVGGLLGASLGNTMGTTVVPPWFDVTRGLDNGNFSSTSDYAVGWTGISGDWSFQPVMNTTVYGLRVVFTGTLHAWNTGGVNYLVRDDACNATGDVFIDHNGGRLGAMVMRDR